MSTIVVDTLESPETRSIGDALRLGTAAGPHVLGAHAIGLIVGNGLLRYHESEPGPKVQQKMARISREDEPMCRVVPVSWLRVALVATMAVAATNVAPGQKPAAYPEVMNKKFTARDVDVQKFVKQFENDSRDVYVNRQEIVRAVSPRPGDSVADIGAGTGLFTLLFAERVGPKGTVYAVDISPAFVKYIAERAERGGYSRVVKTVLNTASSTELPPGSIDVAFLCDTYHHFDEPAKMLASIRRALRPGGKLILIDFDLRKDSGEFVKKRARAAKEVYFREIAAAGFEPIATKEAPTIKDNFYAEFRRVERP
jgi:ubiquinone/menaquinone biosynthesis C-methylase UbiE